MLIFFLFCPMNISCFNNYKSAYTSSYLFNEEQDQGKFKSQINKIK